MRSTRVMLRGVWVILLLAAARADSAPPIKELRTQRIGDATYFHVRFEQPPEMPLPIFAAGPYGEADRRTLARRPQLVPQDARTKAVYPRWQAAGARPNVAFREPSTTPIEGLEFVGKVSTGLKARLLLLYPTQDTASLAGPPKLQRDVAALLTPVRWVETPLKLDFATAKSLPPPSADNDMDLRRLWAEAQANELAVLEVLAPELGFYGFACAATGRKYGVPDPVLEAERKKPEEHVHRRTLDLTTGTMSITQSLALNRLKRAEFRDYGERTIDIRTVPGINIAEHPWQKMMGDKRPAPEPLAKLAPHDHYYVHFKSFRKFAEFSDFLDQWGTTAARAYELNSRDHRIKERYERQLCLKSSWLGRQFGPWLIRSLAVTGSDPYIREGSDVTVMFHVNNRHGFLAGVEPFLQEARDEFKDRLEEAKEKYHGIDIERFVSPLREVSVHRAAFDDFVVYSNSGAALRRVLDTYNGRRLALWDSLDFQYMRTAFRADDKEEDGFAFLSDAFIRQLVGPASKIKEMRRLEALTSLSMLTHGALFTAWETGHLPDDHDALMDATFLRPEHIYRPDGKSLRWDAERQVAVSDVYNTLHFATPLLELPINKITATEDQTYRQFRNEYLRLWQQFFDPVGMRFALKKEQVKLEVYVLPLINNAEYRNLRSLTGVEPVHFDMAKLSPKSLLQFTMSFNDRSIFRDLGPWAMVRLDDGPELMRLAELYLRQDLSPEERAQYQARSGAMIFRLPVTAGIGVRNPKSDSGKQLRELLTGLLGRVGATTSQYKGNTIHRFDFGPDSELVRQLNSPFLNYQVKQVVAYHVELDGGLYVSFSEASIKDVVDRALALRDGKIASGKEVTPINASFHVSPKAAKQGRDALRFYLEWETHKRALPNNAAWYALYRGGLIDAQTPEPDKHAAALTFLGFIPVSPDDTAYRYESRTGEVVNQRHGSLRRPRLHAAIADHSPVQRLLEQFPNLRVDLRFREDGMHATITVQRK